MSRLPDEIRRCEKAAKQIGTEVTLEIHGYADAVGTESRNADLRQRRANKVRDFLVSCGFEPARLKPIGMEQPFKPGPGDKATPEQAQRRVAFKVMTQPTTPRAMIQKKICMIGASGVGKTSLIAKFVHSMFSDKYLTTVGVKIDKKTVSVDGAEVMLMIWDLEGDDDYQRLQTSYLRGTSGYLLVADGTRQITLDQAIEIQGRVAAAIGPVPFLLALNKSDLASQWEIDQSRMDDLTARGWKPFKTSAKEGAGVEEAFVELSRQMIQPH